MIGVIAFGARAARADHYDDLGVRVDAPGGAALQKDDKSVHGQIDVDGVSVSINVLLAVQTDWSQKSIAEMLLSAGTLPGSAGHELSGTLRVVHDHLVADEIWEANDSDVRFESILFPTAKGLYIASWGTPKADFDKTKARRNAFFRDAIAFDGGPPGEEIPKSAARDRVRTVTSADALKAIADTKLKVTYTDTKKSKTFARAKIDQAAWDADLGALFAEVANGGDLICPKETACTLDNPAGAPVEYRFKKNKLVEIRTTAPPSP